MDYYAGIDVSLEASSVCLVDAAGKIIRETKVASEPNALIEHFVSLELAMKRIGLEAGPLSQWLHEGLTKAGFDVVLLETRHVKAALPAMIIKTDRNVTDGMVSRCTFEISRLAGCPGAFDRSQTAASQIA